MNYGEKFYDILDINEQSPLTNGTAFPSGNLDPSGTEPHKIVFVGDSVLLTVAQKNRAVKNIEEGAKYVSEAVDGDIIRILRRGRRELTQGRNTQELRTKGQTTGDYSDLSRKMLSAEHTAAIIAQSRYHNPGQKSNRLHSKSPSGTI